MGSKLIDGVVADITREYDSKFEELLRAYCRVVLRVDLTKDIDQNYVQGFEVYYFARGSVKKIVSTTTGDVLFEVGIDKLNNCIWWHTYWDK